MEQRTFLRNALKSGEPALGMWLTLPGTALAKTMATVGGFNWALIDAEHGVINDGHYFDLCASLTQEEVSPIIRVPADESWMIKRALDAGAHGVMTPMCHTAEQAAKIVRCSKYAPQGIRGCGSECVHQIFGVKGGVYEDQCNGLLLVIVQIESAEGVKNVKGIASTPGVDVLFIGPFDLAKSMDVEFGGMEHDDAIAEVLKAAHAAGKKAAVYCSSGAAAKRRLDQGFDMVSVIADSDALINDCTRQLAVISGKDSA